MPTIEVTKDEADKLREGIREEVHPHARSVVRNADPRYRYRGGTVHTGRPGRIDEWKAKGYEVVPADAKEEWEFGGRRDKEKGGQLRGDQMLLRTPRANFEARVKRSRDKERRRLGEIHEQAMDRINKIARDGTKGRGKLAGPHQDVAYGEPPKLD